MYTAVAAYSGGELRRADHSGLIGCLPDAQLASSKWNRARGPDRTNPTRVPGLANPPFAATAISGSIEVSAEAEAADEGARTVPPHEHSGNCDIKDLSRGSKVIFRFSCKGAGLSVGDLHFSQGDGEITFCGAIEMAGWVHPSRHPFAHQRRHGEIRHQEPDIQTQPDQAELPGLSDFEGISVDDSGTQHYLDVHAPTSRPA